MSFILKSVELNNIRAHEHFIFEPALEGVTAISGDNGAGKSTIVDSIAWSLYGTRPSGIKNRNLIREGVNPKDSPVSVKTIIVVGGIEYAIERKIITASGTTECNVWGKKAGEDEYSQVAGPAVTHVEKFIRNELGMNEKGFLTSILIQQKQVDQIVSATPRERGAVIEELTGIASITHAITKAKETTRSLEKAASIFRVGNIDEATARVEKQEEVCNVIEEKEKYAIDKFIELKAFYNGIEEDLRNQEVKVNKRIQLSQEIESHARQIQFLKTQAEEDLKYISEYKDKYGSTLAVDLEFLKEKVVELRKGAYNSQSNLERYKRELSNFEIELEKVNILKEPFKSKKEAEDKLKDLEETLANFKKTLEELQSKKSMYTSEIKHSKASHEHINGEHKNCPICKSDIEDPESLKEEIMKDIERFEFKKKETTSLISETSKEIKETQDLISKVKISLVALDEEANYKKKIKDLKALIVKEDTSLEGFRVSLKTAEEEYDKGLRIEADKNHLESAKKRSLTVNTTIAENAERKKKLEEEVEKLDALSDRSYSALQKRVAETKERLDKMLLAGKELRGRKELEAERLNDYKKNLAQVEEAMEKYEELAEQIEVSNSASDMLTAFKADRIEHAIPTLEFFASDFLSKFTGGAFTKLTVDEKFNTFVTTGTGHVRPVAQLSGGELSTTSIALRLGIAMLLNSSEKNVLILDEVLVSMDEDRSRQIMETISSMTNSQVIFIAHNSDINSVADKTVLVTKKQ